MGDILSQETAHGVDGGGAQERQRAGSFKGAHAEEELSAALGELFAKHGLAPLAVVRALHVGLETAHRGAPVFGGGAELHHKTAADLNIHIHKHFALWRAGVDNALESGADVAPELYAGTQAVKLLAPYLHTITAIGTETGHAAAPGEGETVAV